jgi:hypothetical protein
MSLMDAGTGHETPRSSRHSARLVVLLVGAVAVIAVAAWLLWPSGRPNGSANRPGPTARATSIAPPAVSPQAPSEPTSSADASSDPRMKRPKAKAETSVGPAAPAAPTAGIIKVESDVAGASVFLDREFKGATPLTIEGIAPGSHRLNVAAEGFQSYADTIDVPAGPSTVEVRFKEVKLNESIKVVHKHTVGSCEGQLIADTTGIRYETSNKDDAFVIKHAEIEIFEVDYLKKNLRIKKRGGRSYNFTNESADALFVFHRNVQAARVRLAKGDAPVGRDK